MISHNPDIVRDYKRVILTPNVVEYARLFEAVVCILSVSPIEHLVPLS